MASNAIFIRGRSDNLPKVTVEMVFDFLGNDRRFTAPEIRGKKQNRSGGKEYGDAAVGYVQLYREGQVCIVRGKICPEHRVRQKAYEVSLKIDEDGMQIEEFSCSGCPAAEGGCKHCLAFLFWCNRRTEEPSPTEVVSYWNKPRLASAVCEGEVITASQLGTEKRKFTVNHDYNNFLADTLKLSKENNVQSVLYESVMLTPMEEEEKLNMHFLSFRYFREEVNPSADGLLHFAKHHMNDDLCSVAYKHTNEQSNSPLWFALRFGRITASRLHEAANCKTTDGTLVNNILGSYNDFMSSAMKRGKELEDPVLKVVGKKMGLKIKKCGIKLCPNYPILGASADGISSKFVFEIKCPSRIATRRNFVGNDGSIKPKVMSQIQLQMLLSEKEKAILCIVSPTFEVDSNVELFPINLDNSKLMNTIRKAEHFWRKNIFPKLKEIYT